MEKNSNFIKEWLDTIAKEQSIDKEVFQLIKKNLVISNQYSLNEASLLSDLIKYCDGEENNG